MVLRARRANQLIARPCPQIILEDGAIILIHVYGCKLRSFVQPISCHIIYELAKTPKKQEVHGQGQGNGNEWFNLVLLINIRLRLG